MEKHKNRIPAEKLHRLCCSEEELGFCQTSLDVPPLEGVIGQERAVRSMHFGLDMAAQGYNIFVVGPVGTGKSTYVDAVVNHVAAKGTVPDDWCFIYNFADQANPLAVSLPPGQGQVFVQDVKELVSDLRLLIPKSFASSDFEQEKDEIVQAAQVQLKEALREIEKEAESAGFLLKQVPGRFIFIPRREDKNLSAEEFKKLPDDEQRDFEERGRVLEKKLEDALSSGRAKEKKAKEKIAELEKEITRAAAEPLVRRLLEKYQDQARIVAYLKALLDDVTGNHEMFKAEEQKESQQLFLAARPDPEEAFARYQVNLFVNNAQTKGAPVVSEPFPYYYNLFGKIEYKSQLMAVTTDFTMARAGAMHKANGGYLVLQARDALLEPFVWDTLKRALKHQSLSVENIGEQYRYVPVATMRLEPIPLQVKVILIGSPLLYYVLSQDEDFAKLFKVKVEFDIEMQRNQENLCKYTSFISAVCQKDNLLPFSQASLARIIEHGSRLAGSQNKLSTRFNEVQEIVYESDALARADKQELVDESHVEKAIFDRKYRNNRIEEKIQEMILDKKVLIDTKGAVTGQINGLSVVGQSDYRFGQPSRITAVTYLGRGGVINIERETKMSGQIHSKGVLTLAGYLGARFAQKFPLSLTAQITFE